jgi:hypothetical protein
MKASPLLLGLSLLANAALVAAYFTAPTGTRRANPDPAQSEADATHATNSARPGGAVKTSATQPAQPSLSWAAIDTKDIDELARRLKAAGFSPAEVRMILSRRIFSATQTGETAKPTPYWRPTYRYDPSSEQAAERRKQVAEQQRLYRKYLAGPEAIADDPERFADARRRWGDLPVEKLQAIAQIDADYQDLSLKQYAESRVRPGETGSVDAYRLIENERLADIAKILSPDEYAAFELRASPLANGLRYQLETFKPTEEEYKVIFGIAKAYQDRWYDPEARKTMGPEMTAKVAAALGADRALDYDAAVNQNGQDQTAGLVSRLGLPARIAAEVRQVQQDLTQRAKDIRANTGLSLAERNTQLIALAQQAESQLTTKLGVNGYEAYNDLKGEWIRALQPKSGP